MQELRGKSSLSIAAVAPGRLALDSSWVEGNRNLLSAMAVVGLGTLVVYAATAAKELLVAHRFGTSDSVDAFLMAMAIPTFAVNVIATSIQPALIPMYMRLKVTRPDAARELFESATLLFTVLLAILSIGFGLNAERLLPILAPGFSPGKLGLTHTLFVWLLPLIAIRGLAKTWSAILNAGNHFSSAAFASAGTPVLIMGLLLVPSFGVMALVAGSVGGAAIEALWVAWPLRRMGVLRMPRWHGFDGHLKEVLRQYMPACVATLLMASATLIDQVLASSLKPGTVAVLSYGTYLVICLQQIASVAVNTAVLPSFTRLVIARDHVRLRGSLAHLTRLVVMFTVPVSLAIVAFSRPLVAILFHHGKFSAADVVAVSDVQVLYCLQVPFYVLNVLLLRCLVAMSRNSVLLWGALLNVTLKLTLNRLLMPRMGVRGIALSTSVMYLTSVVFHYIMLRRCLADAEVHPS